MASKKLHPTSPDSTQADPAAALSLGLSETARALFSAGGAHATLQRVVDLGVETIEGCDFAGIFLVEGDKITTPVHTDPIVAEIDLLQHDTGEGPCLDAITGAVAAVYGEDLADDPRWRRFGPMAASVGVRSVLGMSLSANGTQGALNLYARYPQAFGIVDRGKGLILAALAGVALSTAQGRDEDEQKVENLQAALVTRQLIGQAEGILIERERISSDDAFDILRRASQHLNVKLREIARSLVETGERPDTGE